MAALPGADINDNGWITAGDSSGQAQDCVLMPLDPADIDMDGDEDADDVAAFVSVVLDPPAAPQSQRSRCDYTEDLVVDGIDLQFFVDAYLAVG